MTYRTRNDHSNTELEGARWSAPSRSLRIERARERVLATIESREFDGYDSAADWWDTQVRTYPELFVGENAIPAPAFVGVAQDDATELAESAAAYLASYTGNFGFLVELKARRTRLSERQVAAVLRCKARDEEHAKQAAADPRVQEAREYLEQLNLEGKLNEFTASLHSQLQARGTLSPKQVEALLRRRTAPSAAGAAAITEGMYRMADGTIYKVQRAVHGSGNLYAKRLVPPSEFGGNASFEYAPGALRALKPEDKMTLDQAREFGALYGTCCQCGRTLTDERSIEAGIGPICAGKEMWA